MIPLNFKRVKTRPYRFHLILFWLRTFAFRSIEIIIMLHFISNSVRCDMMLTAVSEEIAKYEYIWSASLVVRVCVRLCGPKNTYY